MKTNLKNISVFFFFPSFLQLQLNIPIIDHQDLPFKQFLSRRQIPENIQLIILHAISLSPSNESNFFFPQIKNKIK